MVSLISTITTGKAQDVGGTGSANAATGAVSLSLEEMVTLKVQPYLDRANMFAVQINSGGSKIAAYETMQTKLNALKSAMANLTSLSIEGNNAFKDRVASLTSTPLLPGAIPSAPNALLTASIASGTALGAHTVIVEQIAESESVRGVSVDKNTYQSAGGSFTINGQTITVNANSSLQQIANAVNDNKDLGVTASVVNVGGGESVLVLTSNETNQAINIGADGNNVLASLGIYANSSGSVSTRFGSSVDSTFAASVNGVIDVNGTSVSISAGDNLATIAGKLTSAGLDAHVVTSGSGKQTLVLSAESKATLAGVTGGDAGGKTLLTALGFTNADDSAIENYGMVQQAQGAILTVDGVGGIRSDSNTISDVIDGVTLNLSAADPNTKVTIGVAQNNEALGTAINAFVSAYNEWQTFVAAQSELVGGQAASTAFLFGDSSLRGASREIDDIIVNMAAGMGAEKGVNLAVIGISLDGNNHLVIDAVKLSEAVQNNYDSVASLFQNQATVTGSDPGANLSVGYNQTNFVGSLTFSTNNGVLKVMSGGADVSQYFELDNGYISAVAGSAYIGIGISTQGVTSTGTVNLGTVTFTKGLANSLYKATDNYSNLMTGSLKATIEYAVQQNTDLSERYNDVMTRAQNYTDYLTLQYGKVSAKIAAANQMLVVLKALMNYGKD